MLIYNSLTREKEKFEPYNPPQVKMYCCGPTVYGLLHVGNFRGAIFYNLVRNWLNRSGYKVEFVYNYTDVDDKIIARAQEEGVSSEQISEKYIQEFRRDYDRLGLSPHDKNPKVTEFMGSIIEMISELIEKKKAYVVNGEVLYSIRSFQGYGKLSNRDPDDLKAGVRIESSLGKQDPLDFALWKPAKAGEPAWPSPWGLGRPGWHIECSAMSRSLLGDQIDLHGGGMDLIFPHHENEIAQTEGCTGRPYVKYWIHNNMINFSGTKMSKSLGNIRTGRAFMDEYGPEIFKYMILSSHYRSVSEFGENAISNSVHALARIYSAMALAESVLKQGGAPDRSIDLNIERAWKKVSDGLNDDFNTPEVFAAIFEVVRFFNSQVNFQVKSGGKIKPEILGMARNYLDFIKELGLLLALFQEPSAEFLIKLDNMLLGKMNLERAVVDRMVAERVDARQRKDFTKSDELRVKLTEMGIAVSDTAEGSHWEVAK